MQTKDALAELLAQAVADLNVQCAAAGVDLGAIEGAGPSEKLDLERFAANRLVAPEEWKKVSSPRCTSQTTSTTL